MTPDETIKLIEASGGDIEFARLLGLEEKPGVQQRVNNWKRRGLPSAVVVENYELIQRLRRVHLRERATA